MQWQFIITLWNSLALCFDMSCCRSHALSLSADQRWGCSWAGAESGAGHRAQKPLLLLSPGALRNPRGMSAVRGNRPGERKQSKRGPRKQEAAERAKEESKGRIAEAQRNIPDYVSAGQIPPCGHTVMRWQDIGVNECASLCLANSFLDFSVVCVFRFLDECLSIIVSFLSRLSLFTQGWTISSITPYFTPFIAHRVSDFRLHLIFVHLFPIPSFFFFFF